MILINEGLLLQLDHYTRGFQRRTIRSHGREPHSIIPNWPANPARVYSVGIFSIYPLLRRRSHNGDGGRSLIPLSKITFLPLNPSLSPQQLNLDSSLTYGWRDPRHNSSSRSYSKFPLLNFDSKSHTHTYREKHVFVCERVREEDYYACGIHWL